MPKQTSLFPDDYDDFFRNLKERIRSTQVKAALAVNRELVLLYWQIGREILQRQQSQLPHPQGDEACTSTSI